MKNSTVFAAALAAGLTTFAAFAQEEAAMQAVAAAAQPPIETTDLAKDDLVGENDDRNAAPKKRGLTAEEAFHEAAARPEIKEPRQKDDVVVAARPTIKEPRQKDDAVSVAAGPAERYGPIIERYASENDVPVELAHAVITVESNYKPYSLGKAGEVGLMQIKPATARMMGYSGSRTGLFDPETNIKYGMKYLGKAKKLGDGSTCGTILKYNAGHAAKRMNPTSRAYCKKVKNHLAMAKATLIGF